MAEIEKVEEKGEEVEYAQRIDEESGYYLKVEKETGEVVKKKTTPGPYKGIPILGKGKEEVSPPVEVEESPPEENKVEEKGERIFISLDDSIEKIVSLDKEGVDLFFEDDPGRFRELPEKVLDDLYKKNRERYKASWEINKRRVREEEHPEEFKTPGITVNPRFATARARLQVEGKKPGFHYVWKAPHELTSAARMGYRIAKHPGLKTFGNEGDETHKVSAFGEDELILAETTQENYDAILKHHSDRSQKRVKDIEASGAAEIRAAGGLSFDPKKTRPGLRWSRTENPNS